MNKGAKPGYFDDYGGTYVPDTLYSALSELEKTYQVIKKKPKFKQQLLELLTEYVGRPSPLFHAKNLSEKIGAKLYLKREDLNHTGAHKINNTLGQILIAQHMGKKRIIAETGAGQHGVATATVCALMGCECIIYMGEKDIERQSLNVYRMQLLGAEVRSVKSGSKTLKDATTAAIRDWMESVETTHYIIGSALGPHPYPSIVRDFQRIVGTETKKQLQKKEGKLPDYIIACVGGGSNAIGIFHPFIEEKSVKLIAVEAGGKGKQNGQHAASLSYGKPGVLHGSYSYLLQTKTGQINDVHSISAGLDYPGVSPIHCYLKDAKRARYTSVTDEDALKAYKLVTKLERIKPSLEPSHAFAEAIKIAPKLSHDTTIIVNSCGDAKKDRDILKERLGVY